MPNKVFVFVEHQNGQIKKGSLELLTAARKSGREIHAGVCGVNTQPLATELGQHSVKVVYAANDKVLSNYNSEIFSGLLVQWIKESGADVVLASSTMMARDLFPRVAAKLESGVASDCTSLELNDSTVKARRPMYSGKCTAEVEFVASPVKIILMRANQLPVEKSTQSAAAQVKETGVKLDNLKTQVKDVVKGASEKPDLTEANVIVSGGRGLQNADNFKILNSLADVLGATVGASRAVADAGWVPHSMQVGQTGKTVAPSLYIACGISGAIQHLAGMSGSKVIVAINKDADAPIFQKATYGIVGDLFEVVPKLTEEFKKALA